MKGEEKELLPKSFYRYELDGRSEGCGNGKKLDFFEFKIHARSSTHIPYFEQKMIRQDPLYPLFLKGLRKPEMFCGTVFEFIKFHSNR